MPGLSASDAAKRALLMIKNELMDWCRSQRLANLDWSKKGTEIWNLTLNMLGTGDKRRAAFRFDAILQETRNIRTLSPQQLQQLHNAYYVFVAMYVECQGHCVPKFHLMFHLVIRAAQTGNCKWYHTFYNESYNGFIARVAKSTHRRTMYDLCHWKISVLQTLKATSPSE